ncbi:hypothetical protein BGW37DRAFT_463913 [Umbelopsis sp. PMI_123]|nr:hypothetical protein BGW37DRAFT_463913 [Umbelopsis sp. PMI_123]
MFMQRSNSDTFLNESITGLPSDLGSYDSNIDPFLAGLTADMYIDPTVNQPGYSDPMNVVHTPNAEIDMPYQEDEYHSYSAEDLWANIMSFDQSVNEDVQPMVIPNVLNPSAADNGAQEFSQSCPQPSSQRPATGMFNYPAKSSPLANPSAASPGGPGRTSDRKGRMTPTVREQGGIRALFSGPKAPQLIEKQPLRRSASAHGKLGVRKKSQLSPRVMRATLPTQNPAKATSDMQATYRMNQQLASYPDSFELSRRSVPLSTSPRNVPFTDPFNANSPPPIYNSFSGYEETMDLERRRSTSLPPPALPPSSMPSFNVPDAVKNMSGGFAFSAPNTPQLANRSVPIKIPRSAKSPPQPVAMSAEEQQKKSDDRLLKIDFDDITVAELKEMLRERKKATNGKKADLVQRLLDERRLLELRSQGGGNTVPNNVPSQISFSMPDNWFMS